MPVIAISRNNSIWILRYSSYEMVGWNSIDEEGRVLRSSGYGECSAIAFNL